MIRKCVLVLAVTALVVTMTGCEPQSEEGVRVSGTPGQGSWPLKGYSEGVIICRGWPPSRPGTLPTDTPWFIFLKTSTGVLFALNGKARQEVDAGRIEGRDFFAELMAENAETERFLVLNKWTSAGVALCKGDKIVAAELAAEANRMAAE